MPFPKGSTALNCCWQVRASHHPRQPLSCGDLPARGEAAALGRHKKTLFRQNKTRARAFRKGRGRRSLGIAPPASPKHAWAVPGGTHRERGAVGISLCSMVPRTSGRGYHSGTTFCQQAARKLLKGVL